ncbi:UDP-2,3-diacylglucosamine pyrophosphatase [Algimonas arctica]|uniref:UDP-2,3-diacylglucosamine pyrophosphatase n=1 Tax=Algimonas arctica TaxID=1479486 RepID=A0A8J3CQI3_9PROT|nr:UDP-2,3-diacylglucosamine diphosphatase LpxI [Algimonas arctica]GHA90716.1 UDP-2,3-diacylglucosamine pyrophosphatase [Algimonas arctica]
MGIPRHIGLIAGGLDLPVNVAKSVIESGDRLTVIEIDPDCPAGQFEGAMRFPLAKFGKVLKTMEKAGVTHVCLAGHVGRPDFSNFKPDLSAMRYLPGTLKAAKEGDDALMRHVMGIFETRGFEIVSAQTLCQSLLLAAGPAGLHSISADQRADAQRAMEVAQLIGEKDIGQGAVVVNGVVLAVEAQEGTDAMLERVAQLPSALRGDAVSRAGVLAKRLKSGQDRRVDLPTIGPKTVELAAAAGLAGIIADAGEAFVIERAETVRLADEHGLFLVGLPKGG